MESILARLGRLKVELVDTDGDEGESGRRAVLFGWVLPTGRRQASI